MKINNPLVSIIVPVYNIEKYVDKCLHSLIDQTYKNIEIIIVNDKSTDMSLKICEEYARRDSRIKIINNKQNIGLSGSRNAGIKKMNGKYIMFVDGDDWIDAKCIQSCVESLEDEVDIVLFPFKKEFSKETVMVDLFEDARLFNEYEVKNQLVRRLFGPYKDELKNPIKMDNISSAWGKMYVSSLFKNKSFIDTKKVGIEDGIMNIACFMDARKIKYIDNVFYHYRKDNLNSLTKTYDKQTFDRWKKLYNEIEKYADNDIYKEALNNRRIINLLTGSLRVTNSMLSYEEKKEELERMLKDDVIKKSFSNFDMKYMTIIWKKYYTLCRNEKVRTLILCNNLISFYKRLKWGNV
ncbi:MAG: glycosyltransferase family A protein [Candidatus Saccharibacteria bacterium]|nr:glycosyltransferase family A protein [Candidatus Saccharibacteria bacterium]